MNPKNINFDRASDYYDETRGFPPHVEELVGGFIAQTAQLAPDTQLLEVGIGTGRIALPLEPHVGRIFGVDISRQMMAQLRRKQAYEIIHLTEADAHHLPFANASMDSAVLVHILHLIANPTHALNEIRRVLKPHASIIHCANTPARGKIDRLNEVWRNFQTQYLAKPDWNEVDGYLPHAGWRERHRETLIYKRTISPRHFINAIENRQWSSTWHMSDDLIQHAVTTLHAAINDHFGGDIDASIEAEHGFTVTVYDPPSIS